MVLPRLELADVLDHAVAMGAHRLDVPPGVPVLEVGSGGFRDEGSQTLVVGVVGQVRELLLDDPQFFAQATQAVAGLAETPLDQTLSHGRSLRTGRAADSGPASVLARRVSIWCPGWDSNPHRTEFEAAASAVGLPGRPVETTGRAR